MLTMQTLEQKRWYTDSSVGIRGASDSKGIPPIWLSLGIFATAVGIVWWQAKLPASKRRF